MRLRKILLHWALFKAQEKIRKDVFMKCHVCGKDIASANSKTNRLLTKSNKKHFFV